MSWQLWFQGWAVFQEGKGPGRGWWGPPKGTHGVGAGTEVSSWAEDRQALPPAFHNTNVPYPRGLSYLNPSNRDRSIAIFYQDDGTLEVSGVVYGGKGRKIVDREKTYHETAGEAREAAERFLGARIEGPVPQSERKQVGDSPAAITKAVEQHAEAQEFPVDVTGIKVVSKTPPGYKEYWHGTDPITDKMIEKKGFQPSEAGALGRGVYLAVDTNKALSYATSPEARERKGKRVGEVGSVIKVAADPGKVLMLTPEKQVEIRTEAKKAAESYFKWVRKQPHDPPAGVSKADYAEAKQKTFLAMHPEWHWSPLEIPRGYKSTVFNLRKYAEGNGYDSMYYPAGNQDPISLLKREGRVVDWIGFKNDEIIIFDPGRVKVVAVVDVKHR